MPKAIVSAEEVLGTTAAGAEVVEQQVPVSEPATEAPPPPEPPPAGFETIPAAESDVPAAEPAPSAEEVLAAEAAAPAVPLPNPALGSVRSEVESRTPDPEAPPAEVKASEPEVKSWRFVKNVHPGEKIRFKDGTEYVFPGPVLPVFDEALATKLLEVADIYHIVQQ